MKAKVPRDNENHNVALIVELLNQPKANSVLPLHPSFVRYNVFPYGASQFESGVQLLGAEDVLLLA